MKINLKLPKLKPVEPPESEIGMEIYQPTPGIVRVNVAGFTLGDFKAGKDGQLVFVRYAGVCAERVSTDIRGRLTVEDGN